ncbi:hypothetical protein [Microcystis aeruginosa]|uniref:hypothetical protein n=1 Tax=Microcystis aeruginosa TaxID=1126 RepID=UPI0020A2E521|nr:hypothetical protein [Microcystis aeruginosa]
MELILKYFALSSPTFGPTSLNKKEVNEYLTDYLIKLCNSITFDRVLEQEKFAKMFLLLDQATNEDTFTKYDETRFKGKFLDSAYEAITTGLRENIDDYSAQDIELLKTKIQEMWSESDFISNIGTGSRARTRMHKMIEFGKKYFKK